MTVESQAERLMEKVVDGVKPQEFLDFLKEELSGLSSEPNSTERGELCLTLTDRIGKLDFGELILTELVEACKKVDVDPQVNTRSIRYRAAVCLRVFLDKMEDK